MRREFIAFSILTPILVIAIGLFLWKPMYWVLIVLIPIILLGIYDMTQPKHSLMRTFPILGRGRYIMEALRPKMYQYFIESDLNGRPFNRINRSIIYQRAKQVLDTAPYGTQLDVYSEGYEWMHHSIKALDHHTLSSDPRVLIGGKDCKQPYTSSVFNVSAMSFGSLSKNAIHALNKGAKEGSFAHNTGEGGISPYHLEAGGDLIFQFGTAYFGCRDTDGKFSVERFREKASLPQVKMIEVKLSQGAKPGHGGILPAKKNTNEIAAIRNIEPGKDVLSPPFHTAFTTPVGLLEFLLELRTLSNGKPVGFKLCIGARYEFLAICKAMIQMDIYPDFISIDGAEGGTGAAPLEFSNSVGMPFREGLAFAYNCLRGFGLQDEIKLIASGKILTGFDIFRAHALGASVCYSARAMMMALGCLQALECNKNTCPTGVATQNPELVAGLDIKDKSKRVLHYQRESVESFVELMAAAGVTAPGEIDRSMVYRRLNMHESKPYSFIYPYIPVGSLLDEDNSPTDWRLDMELADENSFQPKFSIKN
jgi:glutamate synthase domain-containing protein 2